jgi:NADH dehydrogenase FAD-containing subunit/uncharacterized membrane protein YphA (DoxX/SURF4 family)
MLQHFLRALRIVNHTNGRREVLERGTQAMMHSAVSLRIASRWAPPLEKAQGIGGILSSKIAPILDLVVRVWLAQTFFVSGLLKTINWPATVFLYTAEHPVPGLAPPFAATLGTGIELICPPLLLVGLLTRGAAIPLLVSVAVLEITYKSLDTNLYQMLLLGLLIVRGAGPLSLDHAIAPHLAGSALPFARTLQCLGAVLTRFALPPVLLMTRVFIAFVFLEDASTRFGSDTLISSVGSIAIVVFALAFALGLATRVAALGLIAVIPIVSGATMGNDSRVLLSLLVLGFALRGGGALALDRLLAKRLSLVFPSLGADPSWLEGAPRVVIVGAGFGGIAAARNLKHAWANVTVVDRRNYHLFQPLLYQVATASLSPAEIATPIRALVRGQTNCKVVMGRVSGVDTARQEVIAGDRRIAYDYLVLATGARHSYFGKDEWETRAPGLKKIDDATSMRGRILSAFERAEAADDEGERQRLLTFVIVGGGPTGVELAGAIAELARHGMQGEFRSVDPTTTRVVLVQSAPRLLPSMPEGLSAAARASLESLGVEVMTSMKVEEIDEQGVRIGHTRIEAATVLWAAGVMASAAGRWIGAERDGSGRVVVGPDLAIPGMECVFALGDTAACPGADGKSLPGLAAVAKQQGRYIALLIRAQIEGRAAPGSFRYHDWGSMATVGRKAAVADLAGLHLSGSVAWWLWGAVHLAFLVDVRSRVAVLFDWFWSYLTYGRGVRLITGNEGGVD